MCLGIFLKITVQNCFFVLFASWDKELCQVFFFPTGIDKHFLDLHLDFYRAFQVC